jgi:adenosine deaminase
MRDFIDGLPKAELHLHIEGTLEPEMMFALAARNGVSLPYPTVAAVRAAYDFGNLQDFLDLYYQGMAVLRTEQDFYDLASAYFDRAQADAVRHAEIFFDPQAHTSRGVAFETVLDGLTRAQADAASVHGVSSKLIMCFLRDRAVGEAMATLESALPHRDRIVGVGLDSAERGNPPGKFEAVYARARAAGFQAVAHAGEEGPAAYVAEALDALGIVRVDHGNAILDDPALTRRVAEAQIPLTVCPLSNLRLRVVERIEAHPLKRMLAAKLKATVNSDDPAYFGGYVNANYRAIADALGLGRDDLAKLARNAFEASFLSDAEKAERLAELDGYLASSGSSG